MKISNDLLKKISFLYIFLPVIVFFVGFLKIFISIPLVIISIIILYKFMKSTNSKTDFFIPKKYIFIVLIVSLIWCLFSGVGKLFYQPTYFWDHIVRNTIYYDLIMNPWPVHYYDGFYLCYYIGQWLVPSLFGKGILYLTGDAALAYNVGNIMLYIWCAIGIILIFLWLIKISKASSGKMIIYLILMFVFFSGLDIIGSMINGTFKFDSLLNGFEWWLNYEWQYSSFTSLIFWVYNQSIVAIIITLMLYNNDDYENRGVTLISGILFAPYPMLGIGLYILIKDIIKCIKEKNIKLFKRYFSQQNILSLLFIFPILFLFFSANYKVGLDNHIYQEELMIFLGRDLNFWLYLLFIVLEFIIYAILIYNHKKPNTDLHIIVITLMILPLIGMYDLVMRVSIPFLIILFLKIYNFIFDKNSKLYKKIILIILLTVAAINPLAEFNRGIYQTYKQGFIGSSTEEYSIVLLPDYYRYNYISHEESIFFNVLAKESVNNENN